MYTVDDLRLQAVKGLGIGQQPITESSVNAWPHQPGLYAVYGASDVWRLLGLGAPPDERPLYVGKAERSLSSREIGTHFGFAGKGGDSVTGWSTLRRSLAAMLRTPLELRGQYRNRAKPEKPDKYGLSPQHDEALTSWMRENLVASYWVKVSGDVGLVEVERAVLRQLQPPLNLTEVQHQWRKPVKAARAVMAADCARSDRVGRPGDSGGC